MRGLESRPISGLSYGSSHRGPLLKDGWHSEWKLLSIAFILDFAYQIIVLNGVRPLAGLLVAITLAFVPYLMLRGTVNRLVRRRPRSLRSRGGRSLRSRRPRRFAPRVGPRSLRSRGRALASLA